MLKFGDTFNSRNYRRSTTSTISTVVKVSTFVLLVVYVFHVFYDPAKPKPKQSIVRKVKRKYAVSKAIPDQYRELTALTNDFLTVRNWESLVHIGDIYARGVFPYLLPNDKAALWCYQTASKCPDLRVASDAVAKFVDTRKAPVLAVDRQGIPIDTSYANTVCTSAQEIINSLPDSAFRKERLKPKASIPPSPPTMNDIMNMNHPRNVSTPHTRVYPNLTHILNNNDRIGGGNQNTHDHGVNAATRENLKRLKAEFESNYPNYSNEEIISRVLSHCRKLHELSKTDKLVVFSHDDLTNAHEALVSLTDDEYGDTGVTQIGVLKLVVWKLLSLDDDSIRENTFETLCKRLATCSERGALVCATGKISRILSVFEGVLENAQKSVSIDIVEKEIAQLASKVRDDFLKSAGPPAREAYESGHEVPEYSKKMATILCDKVYEEYVEKMGMSKSVIDPIVQVYSDAF